MPSIDYPFPDPQTPEEGAANLRAAEEFNRLETEAADFLDWGRIDAPTPVTTVSAYTVSLLPQDDPQYLAYLVTVTHEFDDMWSVTHSRRTCYLDAEEVWKTPQDLLGDGQSEREAMEECGPGWFGDVDPTYVFPQEDALRMAQNAAPYVTVNEVRAVDLLPRRTEEGTR